MLTRRMLAKVAEMDAQYGESDRHSHGRCAGPAPKRRRPRAPPVEGEETIRVELAVDSHGGAYYKVGPKTD